MQFYKFNFNKRRFSASNFYSFGKNCCRVAVTPRILGNPSILLNHNQVPFCNSSSKAIKETIKIHYRTFKNSKACFEFRKKLKSRFKNYSEKKLIIGKTYRRNKIKYFCVENKQFKDIK